MMSYCVAAVRLLAQKTFCICCVARFIVVRRRSRRGARCDVRCDEKVCPFIRTSLVTSSECAQLRAQGSSKDRTEPTRRDATIEMSEMIWISFAIRIRIMIRKPFF